MIRQSSQLEEKTNYYQTDPSQVTDQLFGLTTNPSDSNVHEFLWKWPKDSPVLMWCSHKIYPALYNDEKEFIYSRVQKLIWNYFDNGFFLEKKTKLAGSSFSNVRLVETVILCFVSHWITLEFWKVGWMLPLSAIWSASVTMETYKLFSKNTLKKKMFLTILDSLSSTYALNLKKCFPLHLTHSCVIPVVGYHSVADIFQLHFSYKAALCIYTTALWWTTV